MCTWQLISQFTIPGVGHQATSDSTLHQHQQQGCTRHNISHLQCQEVQISVLRKLRAGSDHACRKKDKEICINILLQSIVQFRYSFIKPYLASKQKFKQVKSKLMQTVSDEEPDKFIFHKFAKLLCRLKSHLTNLILKIFNLHIVHVM